MHGAAAKPTARKRTKKRKQVRSILEGQWRPVRANRPALCEHSEYQVGVLKRTDCECPEYPL